MRFRPQLCVEDWANNLMFKIGVDDARAWYDRAAALVASGEYPGARVKEPEDVGDSLVTHVVDPAGVLLVFVQSLARRYRGFHRTDDVGGRESRRSSRRRACRRATP